MTRTAEPAPHAGAVPAHAAPVLAIDRDGALLLGGHTAAVLAARHGTPLYVTDGAAVRDRVAAVRALLPAGVRLHYAIKANPLPDLLRLMAPLVDGFDIASAGELALALAAGHSGADLGFAGPGKRDPELAAAIAAGAVVNVESAGELGRLAALARVAGRPARAALRVNPDFSVRRSGIHMGGGAQVFGIDAEEVPALLAAWPPGVRFAGFHVYPGSQSLDGEQLADTLRRSHALCAELAAHAPAAPPDEAPGEATPRLFNLGGGFGIPYFAGETPLDTAPISAALADIAREHHARFPGTRLVLELGRYLVGEAGVFLTRVVDRKRSRGREFLVCDGGMNQHLAASGNLGQVIRRDFPVWLARDLRAHGDTAFTVCGPLCTPLDVLGREVMLPAAVGCGEILAIGQSGAYGASASPTGFLSHPPAAQLLV